MVYDIVTVREKKTFRQEFTLHPKSWLSLTLSFSLDWDWVKFEAANRDCVPKSRGLYTFLVEPEIPNVAHLAFPMYIGQSGDLHRRYGEYLGYQKNPALRPTVHYFLDTWKDHLYFYFVPVPRRKLEPIEKSLNDAVTPPFSDADFSADVRKEENVLRHT